MTGVPTENVLDFFVIHLAGLSFGRDMQGQRVGSRHADVWIPDVAWKYWQPQIDQRDYHDHTRLEQARLILFYDAAWELCRIGVLRPGAFAPNGSAISPSYGDQYTVTEFGMEWLSTAQAQRASVDPSRLATVLLTFEGRFGSGFAQRAAEAVRTYRTNNYLAACVMSGAAAESILLAVAIAKVGSDATVLQEYNSSNGRRKVTNRVTGGLTTGLKSQFAVALNVLHYWRDDAAHGAATTITEIEAFVSLGHLLRLAQFTTDNWSVLIAP